MRSTRAYFIKARTQLWSTERPDIYTQPCFYLVHHVTRRRCREGWVHISFCAQLQLIPAYSSQSSDFSEALAGVGRMKVVQTLS